MKYIGIQGYRGAGKETWSFLLSSILDYLIQSENDKCDLDIEEIGKMSVFQFNQLFKIVNQIDAYEMSLGILMSPKFSAPEGKEIGRAHV